ncbi:unnamed protein product [Strongylus vulgaris]|uniref:Uncharacterized protein n=1 Tax=Strongylus vulgaris TaxID=40348 RepID=A0A3P7JRR3_STRVU|nr:unnamed protein product [Strongylus vulgaris]
MYQVRFACARPSSSHFETSSLHSLVNCSDKRYGLTGGWMGVWCRFALHVPTDYGPSIICYRSELRCVSDRHHLRLRVEMTPALPALSIIVSP